VFGVIDVVEHASGKQQVEAIFGKWQPIAVYLDEIRSARESSRQKSMLRCETSAPVK